MPDPISKETLLRQVDGLRDIARRSRRLAESMAVDAKTGQLTATALPRATER